MLAIEVPGDQENSDLVTNECHDEGLRLPVAAGELCMPLTPLRVAATNASEPTDKTPAQQEGAGQSPARLAADALHGGRTKDEFYMPLPPLRGVEAFRRSGWHYAVRKALRRQFVGLGSYRLTMRRDEE